MEDLKEQLSLLEKEIRTYLKSEIVKHSFPGAVYLVGRKNEVLLEGALGLAVVRPVQIEASASTIYDAASLTKPLITTTLALQAHASGLIDLHAPVSRYAPELDRKDKREITFVDLLSHRSGFQAWYPLYAAGESSEAYFDAIVARPLRYRTGERAVYSCLNFILLYLVLSRLHGRPVAEVAVEQILTPLGLTDAGFNPDPATKLRIAATEWGNANERQMLAQRGVKFKLRDYMIWGEVDDGNSFHMGGVAGNAGLFATAREVYALAREYTPAGQLLTDELRSLALQNYTPGLEENRGLGWQMKATQTTGPSGPLSPSTFGHTGFTGTSVWVDPEKDMIAVLMTNRLHPDVRPFNMQPVRRRFHELIVNGLT